MSITNSFAKSAGNGFKRSLCQARGRGVTFADYALAASFMPVRGFGTFNSVAHLSGSENPVVIAFNRTWPAVYSTLTEVWTDGNGGSANRVSVAGNFYDIPVVITQTGSALPILTMTSSTVTDTTISATGNFSGIAVTYAATLTGLYDPTTSWATDAAAGLTLLDILTYADAANPASAVYLGENSRADPATGNIINPGGTSALIVPISTGSGHQTILGGWFQICAAARGIGMCAFVGPLYESIFAPSIEDYFNNSAAFPATVGRNGHDTCGIVSIKSWWNLKGKPLYGGFAYGGDHKTIRMQSMTLPGGVPTLSASSVAPNYSNPISIPQQIAFTPADVQSNTGLDYGVLGFRTPVL